MKRILFLLTFVMIEFVVSANSPIHLTGAGSISIFQPIYADDTLLSEKILFVNQQIKVDVFQGYAVVRADYWFNNPSDATISLRSGFPSCSNPTQENCSELHWLRVMINNGAPFAPPVLSNDSLKKYLMKGILREEKYSSWQTWDVSFLPGVTEVSLNYGVATGNVKLLTEKDSIAGNAFRYSFSNYQWWGSGKESGEIWMRMNDGYVTKDILGLLPDKKFLAGNSIVHAAMKDVMNDSVSEILLWYRNLNDETIISSQVNWEKGFYKVNDWSVNEKILTTLSLFSATDFEGKAFQHEVQTSSSLLRWSVIASIVIVAAFLLLFIYVDKRPAS